MITGSESSHTVIRQQNPFSYIMQAALYLYMIKMQIDVCVLLCLVFFYLY